MALGQPATTWLRRNVGWSNSRQSWAERLGIAALLAGAMATVVWRERLTAVQHVFVWGVLGMAAAVLLRRGWLKLFGPVLFYDMVRSARRGRYIVLRCLYAGLLLLFLCTVWLNTRHIAVNDRREAARMAENFFETFMAVQLVTVILLTPAYVAGAIADEKDRKTLEFLLATDLRNREIVLSKLVSRLANLTLFLLTGLPILSLIQFLGGVDPNLVLAGGVFTALTMAGLGGLSILNSTYCKKPRDAIALSYLGMVAYLALSFVLFIWQLSRPAALSWPLWFGNTPPTVGDGVSALSAGNVLIVMGKLADAGRTGTLATEIPTLLWQYAVFHGVVFVSFTAWSVGRLRALAARQTQGPSRGRRKSTRRPLRPAVFNQPMIWKELFIEGGIRFNWVGRIMVLVLVIAVLVPGIYIIVKRFDEVLAYWALGPSHQHGGMFNTLAFDMEVYVRMAGTLVACMMLLAVAVRASTSIGGERDRQTLDALLTSPLSSNAILFGKWLGAILCVRWAWLWLGAIWAMGLLTGALHLLALPFLVVAWVVYATFLAGLGLWWSVTARTTMRGTVWTLGTAAGLTVGHWLPWLCCTPLFGPFATVDLDALLKFQTGLTPPIALGIVAFGPDEFHHASSEFTSLLRFVAVGLVVWFFATLWLGVSLRKRFRAKIARGLRRRRSGPARAAPRHGSRIPQSTAEDASA
jgi:ABC-type transport system involved in multi-copper enzyme maturation permease subunit